MRHMFQSGDAVIALWKDVCVIEKLFMRKLFDVEYVSRCYAVIAFSFV